MKNLVLFFVLLLGLNTMAQVEVSRTDCRDTESFYVVFTSVDPNDSIIWLTQDGYDPTPGSSPFIISGDSILIENKDSLPNIILSKMEWYTSSASIDNGGTSFFSQNQINQFDFAGYNASLQNWDVPKETVIKYCTNDHPKVKTLAYGVGSFKSEGEWELKVIFEDPSKMLDTIQGAMSPQEGDSIPWLLSPDYDSIAQTLFGVSLVGQPRMVWGEKYELRNRVRVLAQPTILNPTGFGFNQDSLDALVTCKATFLFYKDNVLVEQIEGAIRPNGNGRLHWPLKSWKVKLDRMPKEDIPFIVTENFGIRTQSTGIEARLSSMIADAVGSGPNIGRSTAQIGMSFFNGYNLENMGAYVIYTSPDKQKARLEFNLSSPMEMSFTSSADGGDILFVMANPSILTEVYYVLSDPVLVQSLSQEELEFYIHTWAVVNYAVHKGYVRPLSFINREAKFFYETDSTLSTTTGYGAAPVIKDDDNGFSLTADVGGVPTDIFSYNHFGILVTRDTALYGNPGDIEPDDIARVPSLAIEAAFTNPAVRETSYNLLIDAFEQGYRYSRTKPLLDKIEEEYNWNRDTYSKIEAINNAMSPATAAWHFAAVDSFLRMAEQAFLKDVMEVYDSSYSLADTSTAYVDLDDVGEDCGIKNGTVTISTMKFEETGTRILFPNLNVPISANPSPGYMFLYWEHDVTLPDTFLYGGNGDLFLKPVFGIELDLCWYQSQLSLNEVLPLAQYDKLEIRNATNETFSLGGMFLSDRLGNLKHMFDDSAVIDAEGFLVIGFKGFGTGADYWIDEFALKAEGETVYLFTPDSLLIDSIRWENAQEGVSYGYCPDVNSASVLLLGSDPVAMDSVTMGYENFCPAEDTTSIGDLNTQEFSVWPNPAVHILNLETVVDQFVIYNTWGQRVLEGNGKDQVDLNNITSGMYILEVTIDNNKQQIKFVKE